MNINRHNYETFFLLYVDNELSAAERKSVEQFVAENPDLQAELQSFIDVTLPEDTVRFDVKESLYKTGIDREALQEDLLMYLDAELNTNDAINTKAIIASDDLARQEWEILQRTKLDAGEKIVFEDKQSLYRYEKDKVVAMRFWRIAAAAAILIACLYTGVTLLRKDKPGDNSTAGTSGNPAKQERTNNKTGIVSNSNDQGQTTGSTDADIKDPVNQVKQSTADKNLANINTNNANHNNSAVVNADKNNIVANTKSGSEKKSNQQPVTNNSKPDLENINNNQRNETIASNVLQKKTDEVIRNKAPEDIIANVQLQEKITTPKAPVIDYNSVPVAPNDYAKTASLEELNEKNDSKVLYMDQEKVAKTKIGGFLRKVKRVIERNTNIKTGNGVSIAGFEIAVK